MDQTAYDQIERAWACTRRLRALSPWVDRKVFNPVGRTQIVSPGWYQARGEVLVIQYARPLTEEDIDNQNATADFVNRSFIVWMATVLEQNGLTQQHVPLTAVQRAKPGGGHVQLTTWLRNRFAHGEQFNASNPKHRETRELLERLFPDAIPSGPGFVTPIDTMLEPLTLGVLEYVRSA